MFDSYQVRHGCFGIGGSLEQDASVGIPSICALLDQSRRLGQLGWEWRDGRLRVSAGLADLSLIRLTGF